MATELPRRLLSETSPIGHERSGTNFHHTNVVTRARRGPAHDGEGATKPLGDKTSGVGHADISSSHQRRASPEDSSRLIRWLLRIRGVLGTAGVPSRHLSSYAVIEKDGSRRASPGAAATSPPRLPASVRRCLQPRNARKTEDICNFITL